MQKLFLTLNLPDKGLAAGIPVVASSNPLLLHLFKKFVLEDWEQRIGSGSNEILRRIDEMELKKLRDTLDLLIPDEGVPDADER
ncbi:MAG: hypothetical protein FJZ95_04720 [Chloroflexi bacterium]|nr:hypothetical protein [Chloroflexota bacterium]